MNRLIYKAIFILLIQNSFAQEQVLEKWNFHKEELPSQTSNVNIPHTWNAEDAFDDEKGYWRGKGVYSRQIDIQDISKKYYLHFGGANQETVVLVNGQEAGNHKGGYTAFDVDITALVKEGPNDIEVIVDNKHDETIPPLDADFTFYGGLYRKVSLVKENPVHFAREHGAVAVKIDATFGPERIGNIKVHSVIENRTTNLSKALLEITVVSLSDDSQVATHSQKVKLKDGRPKVVIDLQIPDPKLWSPETPNLYEVNLEIKDKKGKTLDVSSHNIGFRNFKASTEGFFLNGEPLKLVGVNRHQDWEGLGNAVPIKLQLQDMVKIKEMGSNFLRLAHYPQSEEIYAAADSLGLILWSEIPVVNKVPIGSDYENYERNSLSMQREHIAQNYNHPSLVFIGYMNEIFLRMVFDKPSKKDSVQIVDNSLKLARKLEALTRKEAPNHITVMALHGHQIYNDTGITDIPMVIGWNLYYGWYEGEIYDLGPFLDREHQKFPDRPLIISEYGVGADVRIHTETPRVFDFSEEYQLLYHMGYWEQVHERPFVIGMTAWNYADFGSEFRGDPMPHVNQKGLVNFDRTPKNIYHWYKAVMKPTEPILKIFEDIPVYINESPKKSLRIITNQEVSVSLNGDKLGDKSPELGVVEYNYSLKQGINNIEAKAVQGSLNDSKSVVWKKPEIYETGDYLALNLGAKEYFMAEENTTWIPLTKSMQGIILEGKLKPVKTSSNIRNTENDPMYQTALSGVEKIEVKVPNGKYRIKLFFAQLRKNQKSAYELGKENENDQVQSSQGDTLTINKIHKTTVPKGAMFDSFEETIEIEVEEGMISITNSDSGTTFTLNGLYIEKIQ